MMTQSEVPVNASTPQSDLRILWLPALFCLLLISVESYLLFHDWGASLHSKVSNQGEPIAQFVSGKNKVRQKTVGTLIWEAPVVNMDLFRESAIATMDDSEATLVFSDHSELIVEPNSLLILEEAPSNLITGGTGKIVARLVKGSFKRKSAGPSPFFIKLSRAKDAEAVQIKDTQGNAVFRVMYRAKGYEIVVESGTVVVDEKNTVNAGEKLGTPEPQKLAAPRLKKPKIEILRAKPPSTKKSGASRLWDLFFPNAEASPAQAPAQMSIHFSWEESPGATEYQIQISSSPEFKEVLSEKRTPKLEFSFETPAPAQKTRFYFRVAGITQDGSVGEYSAIEKVDVRPDPQIVELEEPEVVVPEPKPTMKIAAAPTPVPTPSPAPPSSPKPVEQSAVNIPLPSPEKNYLSLWYGLQFQSQTFKESTSNPKGVSGSGFLPSVIGLEFQHAQNQRQFFSAGGSFIFEKARPELTSPSDTPFSVSSTRLWFTYGRSLLAMNQHLAYHFGPYLGSSIKVSENGLVFESKNAWMLGVNAILQSDPELFGSEESLSWRVQMAVLALGNFGVDASAWVRKIIVKNGTLRGLFCGLELETRQTTLESSVGGALDLGFGI